MGSAEGSLPLPIWVAVGITELATFIYLLTYMFMEFFRQEYRRCFQIVVLEKTLESPLDFKELKLVNPKGNQP